MKRFIFSILCVSVFFIGIGALIDRTTAKFKSDEKALELIRKARVTIGGESAIGSVQSMVIIGKTSQTVRVNGVAQPQSGETEIAMQLPDKLMKTIKIGHSDDTATGEKLKGKQVEVVVVGGDKDKMAVTVDGEEDGSSIKKVVVKKGDGTVEEPSGGEAHKVIVRERDSGKATFTSKDGKTYNIDDGNHILLSRAGGNDSHHDAMRHNEILRLTLSLLLTAPQGIDVEYTYGGEGDVEGTTCDIVLASFGGQAFKLFLDRSTNLPMMMSYSGMRTPMTFTSKTVASKEGDKESMIFTHTMNASKDKMAEFRVRLTDYRSTGGMQLPYKWTRTIGGEADETFNVTSYEINPTNIAEKFQHQKVMIRTKKPDSQ